MSVIWHDHNQGTNSNALNFAGVSSSTGGKYNATWYRFNSTFSNTPLFLDPAAGVTSLSFVVNGQLEDQGGLGFAIQDGFMFSETSCSFGLPVAGRIDVAVRIPIPSHFAYHIASG